MAAGGSRNDQDNGDMGGEPVRLWLYDLSQGMARSLAPSLAGIQIDGIWHTSVVVFGSEFCFGAGIEVCPPGAVPHGALVSKIDMGTTHIPKDVFLEYLEHLKSVWTADKYHLTDNNCNSFSNELCQFLVGKPIPSYITSLPAELMNTPLGQSFLPMIENMFGPSRLNTAGPVPTPPPPSAAAAAPPVAALHRQQDHPASHVRPCSSKPELDALLKSHRCVVLDFTSQRCPPCRIISPEFDRLIINANETYRPLGVPGVPQTPILGLSIDMDVARDLADAFSITAMPTFIFFLDGQEVHQFVGADRAELKTQIDLLLYTAYPPHPHSKLNLPTLVDLSRGSPVQFVQSSNVDAIMNKLHGFATDNNITWNETTSTALLNWFKSPTQGRPPISSVPNGVTFLTTLMKQLPPNVAFPVLDLVRLVMAQDTTSKSFFLVGDPDGALASVMHRVAFIPVDSTSTGDDDILSMNPTSIVKPTRMMLLRSGCNLFTPVDRLFPLSCLSPSPSSSSTMSSTTTRSNLVSITIDHLLTPDTSLRQTAALLAFNFAWSLTLLSPVSSPMRYDDAHGVIVMDIVAAICNAIEVDAKGCDDATVTVDDESSFRLVSALGLLLSFATPDIIELAQVVGVADHVKRISKRVKSPVSASEKLVEAGRLKRVLIGKVCDEVLLVVG